MEFLTSKWHCNVLSRFLHPFVPFHSAIRLFAVTFLFFILQLLPHHHVLSLSPFAAVLKKKFVFKNTKNVKVWFPSNHKIEPNIFLTFSYLYSWYSACTALTNSISLFRLSYIVMSPWFQFSSFSKISVIWFKNWAILACTSCCNNRFVFFRNLLISQTNLKFGDFSFRRPDHFRQRFTAPIFFISNNRDHLTQQWIHVVAGVRWLSIKKMPVFQFVKFKILSFK